MGHHRIYAGKVPVSSVHSLVRTWKRFARRKTNSYLKKRRRQEKHVPVGTGRNEVGSAGVNARKGSKRQGDKIKEAALDTSGIGEDDHY